MNMSFLIRHFYVFLFSVSFLFSTAQEKKVKSFNSSLELSNSYGSASIIKFANRTNTYNFMALGYYINANTNMFLKTKDLRYLDNNIQIIYPILIEKGSSNYLTNSWVMNVSKSNQNATVNGQEHLISEGYFFRYVGEFLDIITKNGLYTNYQSAISNGLKYSFTKWKDRSFKKYNDYSLLFHQRLHTGANWAIVALYLMKYDVVHKSDYSLFVDQFDQQLKKALVINKSGGSLYYTWNSTYPEKFCRALKNIKNYTPVIQDVSHGNHVVLYLLKSKELNNKNWQNFNFIYLCNTLKVKILKTYGIADNVDGTTTKSVSNTGWKISDGWMKLIYYDNTLYPIFENSLNNYQLKIKNSFLELQFNSIYP